jgi:hypothetical protein
MIIRKCEYQIGTRSLLKISKSLKIYIKLIYLFRTDTLQVNNIKSYIYTAIFKHFSICNSM